MIRSTLRLWTSPLLAAVLCTGVAHAGYDLEQAFPRLTFVSPTDIQAANDGSNRMFVVEKRGVIRVFESDYNTTTASTFLNISTRVRTSGEAGLLGLAFHPDYAQNGEFFVFYITTIPSRTVVARYKVTADPNVADASSETILIDTPQPNVFHNGGQIQFGPDGMLYIAMGDNRIDAQAQDLTDLPGSILRIDVDVSPPVIGPPYEIPPDNPFAGNTNGYREEIFAYGFRNPWRFCIDHNTGELWSCDVGENTYEEIDIVRSGGNYGWPLMEGPACYQPVTCDTVGANLQAPLYWYTHSEGDAVIGGYRYWGKRLPELAGLYIFGDYTGGVIWALHYDGAGVPERFDLATGAPTLLTMGLGFRDEILMGSSDGKIYRLGRAPTAVDRTPDPGASLVGNYPNPFNPSTTIRYRVGRTAEVTLDIVAADGARVRRLESGMRTVGEHRVTWNGTTESGGRAASGVYFCRMLVDRVAVGAVRLVLLK